MKLAMGQLLVEGGEPRRNFERAEKMVRSAAEQGCDLILFPECMDFAWTHPSALEEAAPIPGVWSDLLISWAKEYRVGICAGLTERTDFGNYNSALLIGPDGAILSHYRKINLLEVERPFYLVGQKLEVVDTPWGKVGVNICSDNYIDALAIGNCLARMGARLILSPSSWTIDHDVVESDRPYGDKWLKPYEMLARLFSLTIVGVTSVGYIVGGPYEGKKMIGQSLAVGPRGLIHASQVNEFAGILDVITLQIDPDPVHVGTQIGANLNKNGLPY